MNDVENTETVIDYINVIADLLDWMQRLWFLIPIIIVAIVFLYKLLCFRNKSKKITIKQVERYSLTGKYIRGLFVELNESKEYIRAFCFNSKWRKRIIRNYNVLFNDKMGKEILNVFSEKKVKLKLSTRCSTNSFKKEFEKTNQFLEKLKNRELTCSPDYKNTDIKYVYWSYWYKKPMELIAKTLSYLNTNYMIVTGTAGNGKSMMLCSVAEQLANSKETVLFFNARDINENLIVFLKKQIVSETIEKTFSVWWKLQNIKCSITGKNIYILIDAINENESIEFLESFADSVEKLMRFGHVKIIISCRSEYFDLRYKKYLVTENLIKEVSYLDLQESDYSYEARERLISNYANYYNFDGELSEAVKEKITRQLLLVRILFETNAGKTDKIFELNKYELYKKYIDGAENADLKNIIQRLTEYMFINKRYENVPLSKMGQISDKYELIDSSILVCRNIIKLEGTIREESEEVINFVYDEMRDYLLTRHMLASCEDEDGNVNYEKIKMCLAELEAQGAICLEGIINYLYNHCYTERNDKMLEFLLFDMIKPRDDQIDEFRERINRQIGSWGLNLLFETDYVGSDIGEKYIDYILRDNPGKQGQKLLIYLLKEESSNGKYTLKILLDGFLRAENAKSFVNRVENTIADWQGEGVTHNDLIKIHKILKKNNEEGAERFSIYAFLIVRFFDWDENSQVEDYITMSCNHRMINKYIDKVKERYF